MSGNPAHSVAPRPCRHMQHDDADEHHHVGEVAPFVPEEGLPKSSTRPAADKFEQVQRALADSAYADSCLMLVDAVGDEGHKADKYVMLAIQSSGSMAFTNS